MVLHSRNYISLCAGIGGLDVGVKVAIPGIRCVCYVERESFAAAVLVARMEDKALDKAPIWSDITTFDCTPWRGCVDFVVAGFPCQPISKSGNRKGEQDERWLWKDVIRVVRELGCRYVLLENVAGILSLGLGTVLGDLAEIGFSAEWICVSASDVGAPHQRERWFCLGYSDIEGLEGWREHNGAGERAVRQASDEMAAQRRGRTGNVEGTQGSPREQTEGSGNAGRGAPHNPSERMFPPPPESPDWDFIPPEAQPAVCGGINGTSERVDRIRALGNGCIPIQFAVAVQELIRRARNRR